MTTHDLIHPPRRWPAAPPRAPLNLETPAEAARRLGLKLTRPPLGTDERTQQQRLTDLLTAAANQLQSLARQPRH